MTDFLLAIANDDTGILAGGILMLLGLGLLTLIAFSEG
jgi:hypothetical protein